jgi:hypothetical protein
MIWVEQQLQRNKISAALLSIKAERCVVERSLLMLSAQFLSKVGGIGQGTGATRTRQTALH